jgi:hypothetical protein
MAVTVVLIVHKTCGYDEAFFLCGTIWMGLARQDVRTATDDAQPRYG